MNDIAKKIVQDIAEVGCSLIGTENGEYMFTYTLGADPEIIVFGLPYEYAHQFLNDIVKGNYKIDEPITDLANASLMLKRVHSTEHTIENYTCWLANMQMSDHDIVQLV